MSKRKRKQKPKTIYVPPEAMPMIEDIVRQLKAAQKRLGKGKGISHMARLRRSFAGDLVRYEYARTMSTAEHWIKAVYKGNYRNTTTAPHWATPQLTDEEVKARVEELRKDVPEMLAVIRQWHEATFGPSREGATAKPASD